MSYTVRVYQNSGFNGVNIPDSPALLNEVPYSDYPSIDTVQNRALPHVDIKVSSYNAIKNADYCKIDDWFYFVDDIIMLSGDVARLSLVPDFITSAGGVNAIQILDGITDRVHVASDDYGEWCENDPLLAPAEPLSYSADLIQGSPTHKVVVKSTLDLVSMGDPTISKDGITYTDPVTNETVTVPKTRINTTVVTQYEAAGTGNTLPQESNTTLFDVSDGTVKQGLSEVNNLGINGAVSEQVAIPENFVDFTIASGRVTKAAGKSIATNLPNCPFSYTGAKNKRLDYSEFTPFVLVSASGDKKEFMPADIFTSLADQNPILQCYTDPRTDGKPYYRFQSYKGDTSLAGFFKDAIAGIPWKQTPLVYQGQSGKTMTGLSLAQELNAKTFNYSQEYEAMSNKTRAKTLGLSAAMIASGVVAGGYLGSAAAGSALGVSAVGKGALATVGAALMQSVNEFTGQAQMRRASEKYDFDKNMELLSYIADTSVYTPVVQFPFSADLYNDLYNNPCLCLRYKYSARDISRIDKLLTMYGYKVTKALERSDFTNREKFNFVSSSISVGGQLPRWLCNGIAIQLANGVRVWHVLPSNSHYTNNPIA